MEYYQNHGPDQYQQDLTAAHTCSEEIPTLNLLNVACLNLA
jgi:hypothetical protein